MENVKSGKKKADLRRGSDSLRFQHNEKGLTRLFMLEEKKGKTPNHAIPHSRSMKYIYPSFYEGTVVLQIQENSRDSEDNIQFKDDIKEWETFGGEIRNTCVSIRIVGKWIRSELFVCV